MLIRVHERWVEELAQQLQRMGPITASGSVMTLPAVVCDLKDWISDKREFLSVQNDDWQQVIDDYRQSLSDVGPKLSAHVELITGSKTMADKDRGARLPTRVVGAAGH